MGNPIIGYKNTLNIGKYRDLEIQEIPEKIEFKIIYNNQENQENDYTTPTFYSDCSNPITLGYINQDIITNFKVSDQQNVISFDGKILKNIGIDLTSFECRITATIHIKNNLGEKFFTNIQLDIPLKAEDGGIYNGYIAKIIQDADNQYYFFKE